jgi:hypothetical protein
VVIVPIIVLEFKASDQPGMLGSLAFVAHWGYLWVSYRFFWMWIGFVHLFVFSLPLFATAWIPHTRLASPKSCSTRGCSCASTLIDSVDWRYEGSQQFRS